MQYTVRIFNSDEASEAECTAASQRFCAALEAGLGDASLVLPMYRAYQRLLHSHGDHARPWNLTPAEQILADGWEKAELAATQAAFGVERYMGDAQFELIDKTS